MVARGLTGLIGLVMGLIAINWIVNPADAAASLAMPLLDGAARSTQVGDFTSFFVCVAGFALYGAWRQESVWLIPSAALLLSAAVFRTLAWAMHGAAFATAAVAVEILFGGILIYAMKAFAKSAKTASPAP